MTKLDKKSYEARKQAVLNQVAQFQEYASYDSTTQDKISNQKLKQLISVAVKSSWWQDRITNSKLSVSDSFQVKLNKLPVLTRSDLQQFSEWMKVWIPGSNPKQYQTSRTSGSTGKPVTLLKYIPGYSTQHLAIQLLDAIWQQRDMSGAFCHLRVNAQDAESNLPAEPFCYESETGPQFIRKLSGTEITDTLTFLAEKQITNILINPIALRLLSNHQINSPVSGIKLQQILTFGDKLDESIRALAYQAFGAKVCDRYSAEELGYLAIQCPHAEHLHALQFYNYIEILDQQNKPVGIGEPGRVVVTSWHSYGMPLIRYELGDIASWGEPCQHGINLPVLKPEIVRIRDISLDANGNIALPRIDKTALSKTPAIADFQIVQFTDGIVCLIRLFEQLSDQQILQIRADLREVFPNHNRIEILADTQLDWLAVWKRKLITRFDEPIPSNLTIDEMKQLLTGNTVVI